MSDRYPRSIDCQNTSVELTRLTANDEAEVLAFAAELPAHDLLFLSRDIQEPKVLAAWVKSIESGEIVSLVARKDGQVVGTTAVVIDPLTWSPHVGELRILVSPGAREIGLGRKLIEESFLIGLDLELEKLTVQMTLDQERAIAVFEEMGFRTEALFKDHVKDRQGVKHDLVMLSLDVLRKGASMSAYGLDEAFED